MTVWLRRYGSRVTKANCPALSFTRPHNVRVLRGPTTIAIENCCFIFSHLDYYQNLTQRGLAMVENDDQDEWSKDLNITEDSPEEEESTFKSYEILNYPADTTIKGYKELWDTDQLIIPDFQRNFVWDQVKASKLIESFLIGLPVPGVFLYKTRDANSYMIIDGQQRIQSVVQFQKGLFGENKFRLKGVAEHWNGKTFEELDDKDKFTLASSVMRATIIQQLSPDDNSSVYHIFERLNTGGVNLNPMEVRKCISYGPFISRLEKTNSASSWRTCLGKPKVDKRLRDVELILRCLAIYQTHQKYEKPMKGFLNEFAELMRNKEDEADKLLGLFLDACGRISNELAPKPFHLRNRLNYGVLDSLLVALMTHPNAKNLQTKVDRLKTDEDYIKSATFNTSDASVLKSRIDKALSVFAH